MVGKKLYWRIVVASPPLSHVATMYECHLIPHCVRNDNITFGCRDWNASDLASTLLPQAGFRQDTLHELALVARVEVYNVMPSGQLQL